MARKRSDWFLLLLIATTGTLAVIGALISGPRDDGAARARRELATAGEWRAARPSATEPRIYAAVAPVWEPPAEVEPASLPLKPALAVDEPTIEPAIDVRPAEKPIVGQISFVPGEKSAANPATGVIKSSPADTAEETVPYTAPQPVDDDTRVFAGAQYGFDPSAGMYGAGAAPVAAWPSEQDCPPVPNFRCGVKCQPGGACYEMNWKAVRPIPWQIFAQGEYVGPHRLRHVPEYRLRVDDLILLVFRLTTVPTETAYQLEVGDELMIESAINPEVKRLISVQPDGMIALRLLGQVYVAGKSVEDVRKDLEERYKKYFNDPSISVTPTKLNSRLEELRATIDNRQGIGGQQREVRVTPEGTIQLPGIGSVPAQGLTLDELKREIDVRYRLMVNGFEVTPLLQARAPRYIYVVGEVKNPGRFELVAPTTAMMSIALAGGWNVGGNLAHVVVFRRDDCWQLMATTLEIHKPLFGKQPCPADEIWLRDSDIIVVPKRPIKVADDAVELIFTRGIYKVFPFNYSVFQGIN